MARRRLRPPKPYAVRFASMRHRNPRRMRALGPVARLADRSTSAWREANGGRGPEPRIWVDEPAIPFRRGTR
jgi:hypothetical protein